ncbi:MAG: hypothetical protein HYX26_08630 [Acidobacteriales bacterium]|nr:hypothetical protein [Terriglobales bacterium]
MRRILTALFFALALPALAANIKLYLKEGGFHMVREYQVLEDRVRYYSNERGEWEEIPLALVDLTRTEKEAVARQATIAEETKADAAEEKAVREQAREISLIPQNPGVYQLENGKLSTFKLAESKVHTSKGRTILKMMAPIPVTGKAALEIDGLSSSHVLTDPRPEFYMQLAAEEQFSIVRLTPQKGVRIVAKLTVVPVVNEVEEHLDNVDIFRRQLDQNLLFKIWPTKPLEPGEYAVIEYTPNKMNMQIWDFTYKPAAK